MKALFCSLATHGFVYPAIAVARELRRLGHQVAFATAPSFAEVLTTEGFERIPRGPRDGQSFQVERWFAPLEVVMQAKHLEYALDRFSPDVVVTHPLSLGALVVRARTSLPTAILGLAVHLWPLGGATGAHLEREQRWAWRHASIMGYLNEARALCKLAPIDPPYEASPLAGDLFMLQSIPELEPEHPRCRLVGSCLWEPDAPDNLRAWFETDAARPLIYVHHGRAFDRPGFWPPLVEALSDLPVRVAASLGRMERDVGPVPPTFLARDHISQQAILPHASLVICGGNSTAVLGALTHGLPSLVVADEGAEHLDAAEVLAAAGTSIVLPAESATPEALRRAVLSLLRDASYAERSATIASAFARRNGPALVTSLLEQLVATRRSAPSGAP